MTLDIKAASWRGMSVGSAVNNRHRYDCPTGNAGEKTTEFKHGSLLD